MELVVQAEHQELKVFKVLQVPKVFKAAKV